LVATAGFEWDAKKDQDNQERHRVSFAKAQLAFADPKRVIAEDLSHSSSEKRHYCFGAVEGGVLTVRFTYREGVIRIFGAGYWRKGGIHFTQVGTRCWGTLDLAVARSQALRPPPQADSER
jgi:hypothetical protein